MSTPSPELQSEMMFIGKECNHAACYLHDFLPFECPACHLPHCQSHFLPSQHQCTSPLPPSMVDRIAPQCPMCNEIVPILKTSDPNEAVEKHILGGTCTGFQGGEERKKAEAKRRRDAGEVCWKKNCQKVLIVKMKCDSCRRDFCPTHRHPNTHTCSTSPSPSSSSSRLASPQPVPYARPAGKASLSRLIPPSMQPPTKVTTTAPQTIKTALQSTPPTPLDVPTASGTGKPHSQKLDARTAAAAAALKRAGQDVKVPFVKSSTEKRSHAESVSQMKALKARHDKGLLTKAEQVKYAELMGEVESDRRSGEKRLGKDKDCVIA